MTNLPRVRVAANVRYCGTDNQLRTRWWFTTGMLAAPGLAVHRPRSHRSDRPDVTRYELTHLPSGLTVAGPACATHIDRAVTAAVASGVDWTVDADVLRQTPALAEIRRLAENSYRHVDCPRGTWPLPVLAGAVVR